MMPEFFCFFLRNLYTVFYVIFWTHRDRLENHEYVASNRDKQFEKLKVRSKKRRKNRA